MYHPSVVSAKISSALQSPQWFYRDSSGNPLPPEYHTRNEVKTVCDQLSSTREFDDMGRVTIRRPFTEPEILWMRNERFLCKVDFRYFVSRYCWILTPIGDSLMPVQFDPWISQSMLLDTISEMEIDRLAIMLIILKARQLGMSRLIALMGLHRILFHSHVNAILASSTPAKTIKLLDMFEFPFERLPFWLVPVVTARQRNGEGGFLEFGNMDSGVTLQHGAQMSGIARGSTPTFAHLSELAEFDHADSIVDASLMRAMHDSPNTLLTLEGTAEGKFNWWHNKWLSAKENWPERKSRLRPVFFPWFVGTDIYPTTTWLRAHPIPDRYVPKPYLIDHARRAQDYVQSNDLLRKYLGSNWSMPPAQQWFYECEYDQAVRENRLHLFLQEMPADDDEAFQSSNFSVFDPHVINSHRKGVRNPIGVYGLVGPESEVPARLQPHRSLIDHSIPPIEVVSSWGTAFPTRYQLVPLRWQGFSADSGLDKVYLWELPQPGEIYGLGIDTSYGVDRDRTSIEVIRKSTPWRVAGQVGEIHSAKMNALDAVPFAMTLGTLFSPEDPKEQGFKRQCRVAIECKGNGDQTQLQMRFRGWHNFHPWQRIDNKKVDPNAYNKIGVYTNEWFRASMMEYLIRMVRDMEIDIRSPWLINELETLESDMESAKVAVQAGGHDDLVLSLGFIIISLYQWEKARPVSVRTSAPEPVQQRSYATYKPNLQETTAYGLE